MTRWGIVSTVKATDDAVLTFCAHHLDLGAHRIYLYLDAPGEAPTDAAIAKLDAHPKIRVLRCDKAWWQRTNGRRPGKHQTRQGHNATHAYRRRIETDWLAHIDVDEFLLPGRSIRDILSDLDTETLCGRMRPDEALSGRGSAYKRFIPPDRNRSSIVADLYPTFGPYFKGGFLSHVAGKLFVRTGIPDMSWRIHNIFQGDDMNPGEVEFGDDIALLHRHAEDWDTWRARFPYRLEKGAYRTEIPAYFPPEKGGMGIHALLSSLASEGEDALRTFFDEVCADTPALRARLEEHGLLRVVDLDLDAKKRTYFP